MNPVLTERDFGTFCKLILSKRVVSVDDFLCVMTYYLEMKVHNVFTRRGYSWRYVELVEQKHLRTSFSACESSLVQRRLLAFRSHRKHEENCSPHAGTDHHLQGRRASASGWKFRRFLTGWVDDLFRRKPEPTSPCV